MKSIRYIFAVAVTLGVPVSLYAGKTCQPTLTWEGLSQSYFAPVGLVEGTKDFFSSSLPQVYVPLKGESSFSLQGYLNDIQTNTVRALFFSSIVLDAEDGSYETRYFLVDQSGKVLTHMRRGHSDEWVIFDECENVVGQVSTQLRFDLWWLISFNKVYSIDYQEIKNNRPWFSDYRPRYEAKIYVKNESENLFEVSGLVSTWSRGSRSYKMHKLFFKPNNEVTPPALPVMITLLLSKFVLL